MPGSQRRKSKDKSVNLRDVANHAGVSPMTVSRVINGEEYVKDATKSKVLASISALNYKPNQFARALAGKRTYKLALLYANPSAFYLSELLVGALEELSQHGHQLLVHKISETASPEVIEESLLELVGEYDGVIVPGPFADFTNVRDFLSVNKMPAVFLSSFEGVSGTKKVCIDDFEASKEITNHLISLGHTRIGFVKGPRKHYSAGERLLGHKHALSESGLGQHKDLLVAGKFTFESGFSAAKKLLAAAPRPTAVFAGNDDMAAGVLAYAASIGIKVPEDLSVVGFDDSPVASAVFPRLTTVRQPLGQMAAGAIRTLLELIRPSPSAQGDGNDVLKVPYRIVHGGSTSSPK